MNEFGIRAGWAVLSPTYGSQSAPFSMKSA